MSTHTYRNPWAKPHELQVYTRNVDPVAYKCCLLFHVCGPQWDVVKVGVCIAQRTGELGAMICAEVVEDIDAPTFEDVRSRMLERHGHI